MGSFVQKTFFCWILFYIFVQTSAWGAPRYSGFPSVFAGYDTTLDEEEAHFVTLAGQAPANAQNIAWTQIGGIPAVLSDPLSLNATVENMQVGWNVFRLTATLPNPDGSTTTSTSDITFKVHASFSLNDVPILPYPQQTTRNAGSFQLRSQHTIGFSDPSLAPLAHILSEDIRLVTGLSLVVSNNPAQQHAVVLRLSPDITHNEGYILDVSASGAVVEARTYQGASWGVVSLIQSLQNSGTLPLIHIADQPFASYRGVLIDVARKYHPIPYMKELVTLCRMNKINHMQLHLNDLEGTAFPFSNPAFQKVPKEFTVWTMDEIKELVSYADARGVTLVPELEGPGHHAGNIRSVYGRSDEKGKNTVIDIANEATYVGMEGLIDELLAVFQSTPYVHIGADESDLGALGKTPEEQTYIQQHNVTNLLGHYITRMNDIVRKKGRTTLVWEGFGGNGGGVPTNVVVMPFESVYNPANALVALGYTVINTAWKPLYVVNSRNWAPDYIYSSWNMWLWEHHVHTQTHIQLSSSDPVLGAQMCAWEQEASIEFESLRERLASMAERTWNPYSTQSFASFDMRNTSNNTRLEELLARAKEQIDTPLGTYKTFTLFDAPLDVTLSTPSKAQIRYTLDGSEPNTTSPLYNGSFTIDGSITNGTPVLYNQRTGSYQTAAALVTLKTRIFFNNVPQGPLAATTSLWKRSSNGTPNMPPVLNAGPDVVSEWPVPDGNITLTGTLNDPDLDQATVPAGFTSGWKQLSGPPATLTPVNAYSRYKNAVKITALSQGSYTFQLYARDTDGNTSIDNVSVKIGSSTPNMPPNTYAGEDQIIAGPLPLSATLTGRASDPDGTIVRYQWTSTPSNANIVLQNPTALSTSATFKAAGVYLLTLTTTDDKGLQSSDQASFTVQERKPPPPPPVNGTAYPFNGVLSNPNKTIPAGQYGKLTGTGGIGWQTGTCSIDFFTDIFDFSIDSGNGNPLTYSGVISGSGSVSYKAASSWSASASVPIVISGAKAHTYTGVTVLEKGRLKLNKTQGVAAVPGHFTMRSQGSNDALEWGASDQISDTANILIESPSGQLLLGNFHEKIRSLSMVSGSKIVFGTATTGLLETTSFTYAGKAYTQGTYTKSNTSFITGQGKIIVAGGAVNLPPSVAASGPRTTELPGPFTLTAQATDADGIASAQWRETSGKNVVFSTPSALNTEVRVTQADTYTFALLVRDTLGASTEVTVNVTVLPQPVYPLPSSNMTEGETVGYSLPLVKGTFANDDSSECVVTNNASGETSRWPVFQKRFKFLVKLKPGNNAISIQTRLKKYALNLVFEDPQNDYKVRVFYFLGSDQNGDIDAPAGVPNTVEEAVKRIQLSSLMLQTFFAESYKKSRDAADPNTVHNKVTFHYALDANGAPKVHIVKHPRTRAELAALGRNTIYAEACFYSNSKSRYINTLPIEEQWDPTHALRMVWTGIAHVNPDTGEYNQGGAALGGAGCGTMHTGNLITHAATLEDVDQAFSDIRPLETQYITNDSYGRSNYWGSYTATLGGFMHEMGHAFKLPHVTVGVMATDASANINRFFSVYVKNNDGSFYGIHDNNEIRNNEPQWQWWTASDIALLEPQTLFIY